MNVVLKILAIAAAVLAPTACDMKRTTPAQPDPWTKLRETMVSRDIRDRGVSNPSVLAVMSAVPRHLYVPESVRDEAYEDHPLPIGHGQTISQPFIVAAMTELCDPKPAHTVLEIGTGSGYQAAVLARLVKQVYTIEIVEPLAHEAAGRLAKLGITNVAVRAGDGYAGWPEHAPFDSIIVTCGAAHVPQPLVEQLKPGGRMVIPVDAPHGAQDLLVIEKQADGTITQRNVMGVRFVPLTRRPAP